jgi:DNA-binding NtrC family response regulator
VKPYREAKQEFERAYFTDLLAETKGCLTQAAQVAQVSRTHLFKMLKRANVASGSAVRRDHYANRGNSAWQSLRH